MRMRAGMGGSSNRARTGKWPAADSLPDPSGPLSKKNNLLHYNEAVSSVATKQPAKRGTYAKFTPQQQAKVAQYASMHGIAAAKRHSSKKLHADLKESTKYILGGSHKKRSHARTLS